jgi:uncharacterized protein YndB with AHSA1/START domain
MRIVSARIARPLEACWRAFTDASALPRWVPGLQAADLVARTAADLPLQIRFRYVAGLTYSLRYTYDIAQRVVRWEPVDEDGQAGGVRGFARFAPVAGGTELTYALEHAAGRRAAERALDSPELLLETFARFMHDEHDR